MSISAAPGVQQTSASAWAARVACVTGVWEPARHLSFPSGALLQHASVAGGGGGGGGAGQQRSSGQPAQPCRADACLAVGRWRGRRRACSTSVNPRRRPSRRSRRRPCPSRPAPTTREPPPSNPQPQHHMRAGAVLTWRARIGALADVSCLTPPSPPCAATRRTSRPRATASAPSFRSSRR